MIKLTAKMTILTAILSLGHGACSSASNETVIPERVTGYVDGQSPSGHSKIGANVRLDYDAPAKIDPGQIGDVNIDFTVGEGASAVTANFGGSKGLEIISGQNYSSDASTGELAAHNVTYRADEAGQYYIYAYVNVTRTFNGKSLGRSLSIPVQIGDQAVIKSKSTPSANISSVAGQKVIMMEAEETIK